MRYLGSKETENEISISQIMDIIKNDLKVMDTSACTLCEQNNIPIVVFDFAAKAEQKLGNRPAYQRQAIGDHSYHPDKSLRGEYSQKKKQMLCLCLPGLLVLGRATARTDFPADKDPVPISRVSYCPPSCLFSASSEAAMTVRQTIDFDMLLFGRLEQNFLPAPTLARRLFFASS